MKRRPPRSTLSSSSAASDVYKRQGILYFSTYHIALFVTYAGPTGGLKYAIFVQSLAQLSGLPLVLYHADIKSNVSPRVMGLLAVCVVIATPIGQHIGMIVNPKTLSLVMCILVATVTTVTLWNNRKAIATVLPGKGKEGTGHEHAPLLQPELAVIGVVPESSSSGGDIRPLLPPVAGFKKDDHTHSEEVAFAAPVGLAYLVTPEEPHWCERHLLLWTLLMGLVNSFCTGLCGIGGGMLMFFMYANLGKAEQRATGTGANLFAGVVRVGQYTLAGFVGGESLFRGEDWPLYVGVAVSSVLGVFLGQVLFKRLRDHQSTMKIVLCCLLVLCSFNLVAGLLQDKVTFHRHSDLQPLPIHGVGHDTVVPASTDNLG
eukprot:TRINITY_DN5463_c0_g1_i2.p1 TRINITY_DN5463_c0_g1~~TRINITY_DN5463_c0_g1_i2.p1  ORF type:complete len:373 (+),score=51.00 TRINITY_DN5463_c0_g1_i2:118-1236(+)